MASTPRVSVCVPVFNGDAFIAEAVRSVLGQGFTDFELVVLDNASTDGTWEILQGFSDPRLVCRRNPVNIGAEGNWNLALAEARGAYIKVLPHDDLLLPGALARQVEALDRHPEAVLAFGGRTVIGPTGKPILVRRSPWPDGPVAAPAIVARCLRSGTNVIGEPASVLFRAAAASAAGAFDGRVPYVIDLDYWLRLLAFGPGVSVRDPVAAFRVSPGQWTSAIGHRQAAQFSAFAEGLRAGGRWPVSRWELRLARLMAWRNQLLRRILLRLLVRGRT